MVRVHFTLDPKAMRDHRISNGWKMYMASYMAPSGRCFHGLPHVAFGPSNRDGSNANLWGGDTASNLIAISCYKHYNAMVGSQIYII